MSCWSCEHDSCELGLCSWQKLNIPSGRERSAQATLFHPHVCAAVRHSILPTAVIRALFHHVQCRVARIRRLRPNRAPASRRRAPWRQAPKTPTVGRWHSAWPWPSPMFFSTLFSNCKASVGYWLANFERPVLGCIEAKFASKC